MTFLVYFPWIQSIRLGPSKPDKKKKGLHAPTSSILVGSFDPNVYLKFWQLVFVLVFVNKNSQKCLTCLKYHWYNKPNEVYISCLFNAVSANDIDQSLHNRAYLSIVPGQGLKGSSVAWCEVVVGWTDDEPACCVDGHRWDIRMWLFSVIIFFRDGASNKQVPSLVHGPTTVSFSTFRCNDRARETESDGDMIERSAGSFPLIPWIRRSVHASMILHFCCLRSSQWQSASVMLRFANKSGSPVRPYPMYIRGNLRTGPPDNAAMPMRSRLHISGQFRANSLCLWIWTNRMWLIQWFVSRSLVPKNFAKFFRFLVTSNL